MTLSRRQFISRSAGISLLGVFQPGRLFAEGLAERLKEAKFTQVKSGENLFLAFNNIRNAEEGESDEFTTIANVRRVLREMNVPQGTTVIGIGARTGGPGPGEAYAHPGEMGYRWELGAPWNANVTSEEDARPVPLGENDPIPVTQVGVLHESSAHRFVLDDPSLAGSVLWTMYNDETRQSDLIDVGLHNAFSDLDGGLLEMIYKTSRKALKTPSSPERWASKRVREKFQKFMPEMKDERVWRNFSSTLAQPFVHSRWLNYVRKQGWQGAAVVLRGSMMNVTQFHLKEWSRISPQDPKFEVGKGTHTFLKLKFGREARPFITPAEGSWSMVGFIWDLERTDSSPAMTDYMRFCDIFGQDFHIHGFRDDGSVGGHTLFSMLGDGKLEVALYPLKFQSEKTAFLFNNDLKPIFESIRQSSSGLRVRIKNEGQNFVRNVDVRLAVEAFFGASETLRIPLMKPNESIEVLFEGKAGRDESSIREIWVDRDGHFIETGEAAKNNRLRFSMK